MALFKQTFEGADFKACREAETFLAARGFSVGSMQRGDPRGILYGDFDIQKWRNLSGNERMFLHGQMTGPMRDGPVTIEIFDTDQLPNEARETLKQSQAA